ncbi:MAG TPA: pirin family protein [Thermodesulfobacteriota bacterium]
MTTQAARTVTQVVPSTRTLEGAGFPVRRPFPTPALDHIDPFLLLDEMGPVRYGPGEARGAPDHPHRGFETVTYLLAGRMRHGDSQGNRGVLGPGDVQWMTAGSGVVHSEMPDPELLERGGPLHGFQLWVNLPARDKMIRPRYQDTPSARIPLVTSADGRVRAKVIAGEALGAAAVIETRTPILYVHFTLEPGAEVEQPVRADFNVFAYPFVGALLAGADGRRIEEGAAAIFSRDGAVVRLAAPADAPGAVEALLVGGQPLGEPVARYGPFVMNTRAELEQAFEDFRSGRFGTIPAQVG